MNNMNTLLLVGFPKVGNTMCRFLILNYFRIKNFGVTRTLTYEELSIEQPHRIERDVMNSYNLFGYTPFQFKEGYPHLYHTHVGANPTYGFYFKKFDKICYLLRNPYDTMISYHYYLSNRKQPFMRFSEKKRKLFMNVENFSMYAIEKYVRHFLSIYKMVDLFLHYEEIKQDPKREFTKLLKLFGISIDQHVLQKAIEMSSFESIKQMGRKTHQASGLSKAYQGEFTRDGRVGQYKEIMSDELIKYITTKFKKVQDKLKKVK